MAIKCTYLELSKTGPGLQKLAALDRKSGASHVDLARISRFVQLVLRELQAYEKLHGELLELYGKPLPSHCPKCGEALSNVPSGSFHILPERRGEYRAELEKLGAIEADGLPSRPLPLSLWKFADLSVAEQIAMEKLIEWPAEADEPAPGTEPPAP
jgi:hypothetical protein